MHAQHDPLLEHLDRARRRLGQLAHGRQALSLAVLSQKLGDGLGVAFARHVRRARQEVVGAGDLLGPLDHHVFDAAVHAEVDHLAHLGVFEQHLDRLAKLGLRVAYLSDHTDTH